MSKTHNQKNQIGYNAWSAFYDQYPNPTVAIDDLTFPAHWQHLEHKHVLEIGCGTGRHTRRLLEQNNSVVGIDASEGMLEIAKKKLPSEKLELIHGDILTHKFPKDFFHVAISSLVIEHIANLDLLFQKLHHGLIAGGEFYLSEIHPTRTAQGIMAHFKTEDGSEIHLNSYPHSEADLELAAYKAGFDIISKETIMGNEALAALNSKWQKHLKNPLIQIWKFKKKS